MKEPILFKAGEELRSCSKKNIEVARFEKQFTFDEVSDETGLSEFTFEAAEGSILEAIVFQNVAQTHQTHVKIHVKAAKDALVRLTVIQKGGLKSQVDILSETLGSGSLIEVRGLQTAKNKQRFSFQASAKHAVPHTQSDLQVWCVAGDEAQSIFSGLVTIEKGAHHTEAYQRNKNLLLSERATIDTIPKLFIGNDDVKCAHGSSVAQLEPEQFYYLQSRGIDQAQAEKMLVQGFMHQAIEWIENEASKTKIEQALGLTEEDFA